MPRFSTPAKTLYLTLLSHTQIADAGCAALLAALDGGALPALERLYLYGAPASEAARAVLMARFPADSDDDWVSDASDED